MGQVIGVYCKLAADPPPDTQQGHQPEPQKLPKVRVQGLQLLAGWLAGGWLAGRSHMGICCV